MTVLDLITKEDLEKFKAELFHELKLILNPSKNEHPNKLLRSKDVRKKLNISSGTLQTWRINGTLPFTKIGKIIFYEPEDIERILKINQSLT